MKNPKPYIKQIGKSNWKGVLVGNNDAGKGRRSVVILGQPKNGFTSHHEAVVFVRNKWHRRQDMVAFASKAGNGSPVSPKDTLKEVRFQSGHPLHRGANGNKPKRLTKNEQEAPAYAAPEVTIDTRKNAIEFIIASAGINGRMVNEQEAGRILDAIGEVINSEHELPQEDLMESLSDAYMNQQADLMNNDPAKMKPEDVQAQLRYLDVRKNMLEQHIQ